MEAARIKGLPPVPPVIKPVRPRDFRCECVCIEVQKILDARKQKECQVFTRLEQFGIAPRTLPLIDINQNPITTVDWTPHDDIVCLRAIFKENHKEQIFVIEKPPQEFTVDPLGGKPPAARITVTVTPGKNPDPIPNPHLRCRVKETVLAELENRTPGRTPRTGFIEICPVRFIKRPVLFFPDQEQVGVVSVKTESAWEILDCDTEICLNVLRVDVTVGAFLIVKTWADVQLVTTAMGECDWELVPPPFPEDPCEAFKARPFPPFNPPQLEDFFVPDPEKGNS